MELCQLIIPSESAHDTLAELGQVGLLQFKDLNEDKTTFQRAYAGQVKRCDELMRKLRFFKEQVSQEGIDMPPASSSEESLDALESRLSPMESELIEVNGNTDKLQKSHSELLELQLVLEKASSFFEEARADAGASQEASAMYSSQSDPLLSGGGEDPDGQNGSGKSVKLGFVTGILPSAKANAFERVLFRATRGNMYLKQSPIDGKVSDPASGEKIEKTVFVVFFAGERARAKILKICEAFGANRYPFPEDASRQRQMNAEVTTRLNDLDTTLEASKRQRKETLRSIAEELNTWLSLVIKEKSIYHTLNKLSIDVARQCMVGQAWTPLDDKEKNHAALQRADHSAQSSVTSIFQPIPTKEMPPTYFDTSKITSSFQAIVEAYGNPDYREANPTLLTIVTFPFLFAVMFGDFGHGTIMLIFALLMVVFEKRLTAAAQANEIFGLMFGGRYPILLMAVFSIYTGALYNECLSLPMTLFGPSVYSEDGSERSGVYPFGLDPQWHISDSELTFINSIKMKMSIIIGVVHMTAGIVMSLFNHLYHKDKLGVYFEFIPQVCLLLSLFGYLSFLIVLKWVSPPHVADGADLYATMIQMFLSPGSVPEEMRLYPGQGFVQVLLLLVAVASVPTMLLVKPLVEKRRHDKQVGGSAFYQLDESEEDGEEEGGEHVEDFNFGETLIYQMIHTIEFTIGVVSNTASYLRLWALSLAHAELSKVFFQMVLLTSISTNYTFLLVIGEAVFFCATFGVLMVMESLSAFLHCLRLHWVEYQNKFFNGEGHKFAPFSFSDALSEESL